MLQQFTWQQFLVAISVLSLVWYCTIILLYYRRELKAFLNGKSQKEDVPLPHRWDDKFDELEKEVDDHLMGKSKLPDGVSIVGMDDIQFVDDNAQTERLGLISDVIEEIMIIFNILGKEDGSKQDFLNLISTVKENYPGISSNANLPQINNFIVSNAPFHLTNDEVENLWC